MIIKKGQASEVQTPPFSRKQVTFLVTEKREIQSFTLNQKYNVFTFLPDNLQ